MRVSMKRGAALLLVVLALTPVGSRAVDGGAGASDSTRLSLLSAVERSLGQYPTVGAARASQDEARAVAGSALSAWYPSLRVSGSATEYQKPYLVLPLHSFNLNPRNLPAFSRSIAQGALTANYLLFNGGIRESRIREARARAAGADAALGAAEQALVANVTAAYLDVIGAAQILQAHDRRLIALRSERTRIAQQLEVGRAARVDLLRIDATIASAEADRVRGAAALDTGERNLALLVGAPPDSVRSARLKTVALADTVLVARDALVARAFRASPAIEQGRRQLAAARAGLGAARGARWPNLSLAGNYLGFADLNDMSGDKETEWSAAAQISMPIFTGGQISRDIERARAAERGAAEQLRLAETQAQQQIDRSISSVEEAHARVMSLTSAAVTFREVARIQDLSYQAGVGTQTDYLTAVADLFSAEANLVGARFQEIKSRIELARITGVLTADWLAGNLEDAR